ncbi:MAG: UvrD-helicase domain-containing protein [Bacteroidales bacterium]|jgi:DNA helicase-2/ATP-dependent DNA helicase PcrA|nr:UvrD-helicase domain-containing protein [Bacteroidales bacterium]
MTDFLHELNDTQREAVVNYNGPSLIIAGAGSGKTRVLTYRIAYLLTQGITPGSILALTFTNKAAKEMKERIAKLVGEEQARRLWMGTFHSVFARILRSEAAAIGFTSNFSIYDAQDSKNVVRQIIKDMHLDDSIYKANDVYNRISSAKNNLVTAAAYGTHSELTLQDSAARRPLTGQIYKSYQQRCTKADAMDFDDILVNTNILFRDHPEILDKYQRFYRYILVDEYQDTNSAQYMIVKKLAQQRCNICVVGDDAQSIYAFRGARIENILNFRNDYPNYRMFKLEQNYRSTQTIVNAANTLIAKNQYRIKKEVFSENQNGDLIRVFNVSTDQEEGYVVAASITEMKYQHQLEHKNFAILYRTNAQSRIFEEALRKRNLPYRIFGGLSFYERKEVKDILAYGRLLINPKDDEAFRRIINFPARGIGNTTLSRLEAVANARNLSLWEVAVQAPQLAPDISPATRTKLWKFINFMQSFAKDCTILDAYELLHRMVIATGIISSLQAEKTPENISRLQNIDELLNGIREFVTENTTDNGLVGLDQYLANVALLTNADQAEEDNDKISMMTIHASKGLEFEVVYIVGLEENLFPSQMAINSMQDIEEERRLFYVALTRAKRNLFLSSAGSRFRWGSMSVSSPSRFIKEIDVQYLEFSVNGNVQCIIPNYSNPVFAPSFSMKPKSAAGNPVTPNFKPLDKARTEFTASTQQATNPDDIRPGMTVDHQRFGRGKVLSLEDDGPNTKVMIHFNEAGQKQLLLKFAKLVRVTG